jgi:hypothetical protein
VISSAIVRTNKPDFLYILWESDFPQMTHEEGKSHIIQARLYILNGILELNTLTSPSNYGAKRRARTPPHVMDFGTARASPAPVPVPERSNRALKVIQLSSFEAS